MSIEWRILKAYPDPETEVLWNQLLDAASYPTHYVSPGFFVDPFAGEGERFAIIAMEGGIATAVMTGTIANGTAVSGLAVRPQTAFRIGCDRESAAQALIRGLIELGGAGLEQIKFSTWEPVEGIASLGFRLEPTRPDDEVILLDLAKGKDDIFKDFSQTRRNELRKVMKLGLIDAKEVETRDELLQLYDIHKDWNRRKGYEPNSLEKFEQAIEQRDHRKVLIAIADGKVIAGSYFRFCRGGVVEYAANNSLELFQKLRPNDLLCWRAIEWACDAGFSHFSMGGSHLFLRRFGGEAYSTFRYSLDRTFLRRHEKRERLSRFAVNTYLSLPDTLRRRIRSVSTKV